MARVHKNAAGTWGFRYQKGLYRGRPYRRYGFQDKETAEIAQAVFIDGVKVRPKPRDRSSRLEPAINAYLAYSAEIKKRSQWRLDGLRYGFRKWTIPYFGANTLLEDISPEDVERFIAHLSDAGKANKTSWNIVMDLQALFNWGRTRKEPIVLTNPVKAADKDVIADRVVDKFPLHRELFDKAVICLSGVNKAWFNFTRFTGYRMDEANRLRWDDVDLGQGLMIPPGTKTKDAHKMLPMARVVIEELLALRKLSDPSCPWVFPGEDGQKIYYRRRMFEHIEKQTGIKLRPKDLRDYFCGITAENTPDVTVLMKLLRHKSLLTTTKYVTVTQDRLRAAVENLGK